MNQNKLTANEFSLYIEKVAATQKTNYIDAVISYCETHMIEPEEISSLINISLKEKLANDYKQLNYISKKPTLNM